MPSHNGEKGIPISSKKRLFVLIDHRDVKFLARAYHHIYKPAFLNATDLSWKSELPWMEGLLMSGQLAECEARLMQAMMSWMDG